MVKTRKKGKKEMGNYYGVARLSPPDYIRKTFYSREEAEAWVAMQSDLKSWIVVVY